MTQRAITLPARILSLSLLAAAATQACGSQAPKPGEQSFIDAGAGDTAAPTDSPSSTPDGPSLPDGSSPSDGSTPSDSPLPIDAAFDQTGTITPTSDSGVLCAPGAVWGPPVPVLTTGAADATVFGSVTPDELSLAWTSRTGSVVTTWTTDRSSAGGVFGAPQALASTFGATALDRVSLSADGLRLVAAKADGTGFVAAKRTSRGSAFNTDDAVEFANVRMSSEGVNVLVATPVLAPSGTQFLYIATSDPSNNVDYVAFGSPPWPSGGSIVASQLQRSGTQYRRPSGVSVDDLALFYWDEVTGTEKITRRLTASGSFTGAEDIGALTNAVPTAKCSRIYYSVPAADGGGGAIDIVYADLDPDAQ